MPDRSTDPNIDRFFEQPGAPVKLRERDGTPVVGAHWPTVEEIIERARVNRGELDSTAE